VFSNFIPGILNFAIAHYKTKETLYANRIYREYYSIMQYSMFATIIYNYSLRALYTYNAHNHNIIILTYYYFTYTRVYLIIIFNGNITYF